MSAAASPSESPPFEGHQRSSGSIDVSFRLREGRTVLGTLRQEGCLKARLPRCGGMELVTLNCGGGIAAGDRLALDATFTPGTCATLTSQAAERAYRALPGAGPAIVRTRLHLAAGAVAEWLPQETILFEGCALDRRLLIEMDEGATFLGAEMLVFGRAAMGERVTSLRLDDAIGLRRGGRLVLRDAIRFIGAPRLERAAIGRGDAAYAVLLLAAPDAEHHLDGLRSALPGEAGVSAWDGLLVARILAPTGAALRRIVIDGLRTLRGARKLPRMWQL